MNLGLAVMFFCVTTFAAGQAFAQPLRVPYNTVRVTANMLSVRAGPGQKFRIVDRVPRGTLLKVINVQGPWLQVRRPRGPVGWVSSAYTVRVR